MKCTVDLEQMNPLSNLTNYLHANAHRIICAVRLVNRTVICCTYIPKHNGFLMEIIPLLLAQNNEKKLLHTSTKAMMTINFLFFYSILLLDDPFNILDCYCYVIRMYLHYKERDSVCLFIFCMRVHKSQ